MKIHKARSIALIPLLIALSLCIIGMLQFAIYATQRRIDNETDQRLRSLSSEDLVVVVVGDVACAPYDEGYNNGNGNGEECRHKDVAKAIKKEKHIDALVLVGDIQYQKGELENYYESFAPEWSGIKADAVLAVPGNHDWANGGIDNYQIAMPKIFPNIVRTSVERPYFSWQKNSWQFIGLDSDCGKIGGCGEDALQATWLKSTLANSHSRCSLAFWHHPVFNSGQHRIDGTNQYMRPAWRILDRAGVDLALVGHEHIYERFKPLSLDSSDGKGIREIMVGTGGRNLYNFVLPYEVGHEAGVRDFGYLKLHLRHGAYTWQFIDIAGNIRDEGKSSCHN